jgi:uncharacterized membrane protein
MSRDPADRPADVATIRELHSSGLLSDKGYEAALRLVRPPATWWLWASRMLLLVGGALLVGGVIFFFAYNWARIGHFAKFGLIEAAMAGSAAGACYLGRERIGGKLLLLCASVFVGVLLAVYGQTYQTGADAFELFTGWAGLIAGFVIIGNFAGLWVLWLAILETGLVLCFIQVAVPVYEVRYETLCLVLAAVNGSALGAREFGLTRGLAWLGGRWLREVLVLAAFVVLVIPTLGFIIEPDFDAGVALVTVFLCLVALVGGYAIYRFLLPDMIPLVIIILAGCIILWTGVGKILFEGAEDATGPVFLMSLCILVVTALVVMWLRGTAQSVAEEKNG